MRHAKAGVLTAPARSAAIPTGMAIPAVTTIPTGTAMIATVLRMLTTPTGPTVLRERRSNDEKNDSNNDQAHHSFNPC